MQLKACLLLKVTEDGSSLASSLRLQFVRIDRQCPDPLPVWVGWKRLPEWLRDAPTVRRPSRKPFGEPPFDWTDTPAASGADLGRRGRANRGNEPIAEGKAYLRRRGLRTSRSRPGITLAGLSLYESMIIW